MTNFAGLRWARAVFLFCAAAAIASPAQTFTTLVKFDGTNGSSPYGVLVQATNGNFYGTTLGGGANARGGTVFEIASAGKLTTLYSFCAQLFCADGEDPYAGVTQAINGNFYGTTSEGGANGYGTVFEMTSAGTLTTLYSFCAQTNCTDGDDPQAGLVQGTNGNFYGTTSAGGADGYGTVFEITPGGTLTTLYSFCSQSNCADGEYPQAGLVQATNGDFYGTTLEGGAKGRGSVFEINSAGKLTTLYSFCTLANCADGSSPIAGLVQAGNGNFYGTTSAGGADGYGTVFEITPGGTLTTLHSFCSELNCTDGASPYAGLVQASSGNFYGTTWVGGTGGEGGENGGGTVFEITPAGQFTTLYKFCTKGYPCSDGDNPYAGLMQATNGTFYGTTSHGGNDDCSPDGCGTVFSLDVGLAPFVKTLPGSGKVGAEVGILGTKLTGATAVTFNGTPAQFKVTSSTLILTHVPTGATTGTVKVTLPGQTLSSNVPFYVLP